MPRFAADPLHVVEGNGSMKERQPEDAPEGRPGPAGQACAPAQAAAAAAPEALTPAGIRLFWA